MFQIKQDTLKYPNGCIQYIINEYSFNSYPILPSLPSIMIQNINICFDIQTKCANDIWGYHNYNVWNNTTLTVPDFVRGKLILTLDIKDDDVYRIERANKWKTFYDLQSGWICIGNLYTGICKAYIDKDNGCIEFYPNVIAIICNSELEAIWIKPTILDK